MTIENLITAIENKERSSELTERQKKNRIRKDLKELNQILEMKKVKEIKINVEWKKSIYGLNPHLTAWVRYIDDSLEKFGIYKASGCGYDKLSTVMADLLNDCMKNELLNNLEIITDKNNNIPYGIGTHSIKKGYLPYFEGAVGISCYYDIMKFLGYKLTQVASGEAFDAFTIDVITNEN